jgi:hypothetical protein
MMTSCFRTTTPSRYTNPFATCWTRPGAIPFQFAADDSAAHCLARLAASNWRGAIVGPHGSGKSTLLEALRPGLVDAGWNVAVIALRDGQRRLPAGWLRSSLAADRPLIVLDGYEQLSRASRLALRWRCHRAAAGLLVTAHSPVDLQTIYCSGSSLQLSCAIVSRLTARIASPISAVDIAASHARCGSNLRELLFELYARHEAMARGAVVESVRL